MGFSTLFVWALYEIIKKIDAALADLPVATWIRVPFNSELELLEVINASSEKKWAITVNVAGSVDVSNANFSGPVKTLR